MDSSSSKESQNEDNLIKVFLEASLNTKVEYIDKSIIHKPDISEEDLNKVTYKVWISQREIVNELKNFSSRTSEYSSDRKFHQSNPYIKFKLGKINLKDVPCDETGLYSLVMGIADVGKSPPFYTDESSDPEFKFSKEDNETTSDCFYIYKKNIDYEQNKNDALHYYAVRAKRITYLYFVNFRIDKKPEEQIACAGTCQSKYDLNQLWYCHNDNKYFCLACDDAFHNKGNHQVLRKHKRTPTNNFSYSLIHKEKCSYDLNHKTKPYDFFCPKCLSVFCIKCLDLHKNKDKDHEIKSVDEYLAKHYEKEVETLKEQVRGMVKDIKDEIDELEKNSGTIQQQFSGHEKVINTRMANTKRDLEQEVLNRCSYLASISIEVQRLISEIENKVSFLKQQYFNTDNATYISMTIIFMNYMKNEVFPNLELLMSINFEGITGQLHELKKSDKNQDYTK